MITIFEKFNKEFTIVKMNQNSLTLINKDGQHFYIHRNAYNELLNNNVVDYRTTTFKSNPKLSTLWVEVLSWKRI